MVLAYERDGAVAIVTLDRPEVLNAFNDELGERALDALHAAASDDAIRCILIRGSGKAFCAGEDLGALAEDYENGRAPALGDTLVRRYNPLIRSIRAAPKPVVASINGAAAGAGASIALACDFRIASEKAKLILAFTKVGLIPDSGALWFLTRMVGAARAWELAVSARALGAEEASGLGLFDKVVPADDLDAASRSFCAELAAGPTRAYALTKRLVASAAEVTLDEQLDLEVDAQTEAGKTHDHMEGVKAFLNRRDADFEGR